MIVKQAITVQLERLAESQFGQRVEERREIPLLAEHPRPIVATAKA